MNENIIVSLQEPIMAVLGIGVSFVALFILYRALQMRNKERLFLIEKGLDPSRISSKSKESLQNDRKHGLLLIAIAVGVILGYVMNHVLGIPEFVSYASIILLLCGCTLLYVHHSGKDNE